MTNHDHSGADVGEKAFWCMCFNDFPKYLRKDNYLCQYFILRDGPMPNFLEGGYCPVSPLRDFRSITTLVNHYWEDHYDKLKEFLEHVQRNTEPRSSINNEAKYLVQFFALVPDRATPPGDGDC